MADKRIVDLPLATGPTAPALSDVVAIDGVTTRKATFQQLGDVAVPIASQAEATAGVNASKRMTPLTTKQSIASEVGGTVQGFSANLSTLSGIAAGDAGSTVLSSITIADILAYLGVAPSYGRYKLEQYVPVGQPINATTLGAAMQTALNDRAAGGAMVGKPLLVPAQKIDMTDCWVFPAGIKVYWGGQHPSFKRYNDTTGGQPHPYAGTVISTRGSGTARVWSDRDVGGDAAVKPAFILLGESGYFFGGFTLITGEDGAATCWDMGLYRMSSGWTIYDPQVRGYNNTSSWKIAADFWDATWGPANTSHPALSNGKIPAWFNIATSDYGLTNNRTYNPDLRGVSSISILGTTRTGIPDANWVWAPNGLSDSHYFAPALYGEGDVTLRQGDGTSMSGGADIRISYQVRSGVPAQGIALLGCNGDSDRLWALDLNYINRLSISSGIQFFESSDSWQSIQVAAGKPTEQQRARINRTANTGSILLDGQYQVNLALNGSGNVNLSTHRYRDQGGDKISRRPFDGFSAAGFLSPGPGRNLSTELQVFDSAGSFKVVDLGSGGVDTIQNSRRLGASGSGKSETSYNGSDWYSYETGSWTPTLEGATTPGTYAYSLNSGSWTRNGRVVRAKGSITLSAITVAGTGQMRIAGLPFLSRNNTANASALEVGDVNAVSLTAGTIPAGFLAPNTQVIGLTMRGSTGDTNMTSANLTATSRIRFEIEYEV